MSLKGHVLLEGDGRGPVPRAAVEHELDESVSADPSAEDRPLVPRLSGVHRVPMAADDDSSSDSEKSGIPWLGILGVAGAIGSIVYAVYSQDRQKREIEELALSICRLEDAERERQRKSEEALERVVTFVTEKISSKIEARIDERAGKRLDAADARFNRRIDQISDSGASAVEQLLRETTRRSDEIIGKAESRLKHIGWLGDQVAPAPSGSRSSTTADDDDPVWAELGDFQSQFES